MSQPQTAASDTASTASRSNSTPPRPITYRPKEPDISLYDFKNLTNEVNTSRSLPLTLAHARNLINAEAFAASLNTDTPLLVHITMHLKLSADFKASEWNTFQTYLMDKANCWLLRQRLSLAYIWTRECGPDKGPHLHWFIHLPQPYWASFEAFLRKTGHFEEYREGSKDIVFNGARYGTRALTRRAAVLKYILKSLDASPSTLSKLGIKPEASEPVQFQRCGATHSLSLKARSKAGWKELQSIEELGEYLNPPPSGGYFNT